MVAGGGASVIYAYVITTFTKLTLPIDKLTVDDFYLKWLPHLINCWCILSLLITAVEICCPTSRKLALLNLVVCLFNLFVMLNVSNWFKI